jgi:hypothetical protein
LGFPENIETVGISLKTIGKKGNQQLKGVGWNKSLTPGLHLDLECNSFRVSVLSLQLVSATQLYFVPITNALQRCYYCAKKITKEKT